MREQLINKVIATSGFLSPLHFNSLRYGGTIEGVFIENGIIEAKGEHYRVIHQPDFRIDEPVVIFLANAYDLAFETAREREDRERIKLAEQVRKRVVEKVVSEAKEKARKERIASFYAAYSIPFLFSPQIKIVLSGLTENSMGNGTKKNTVHHLYVLESFKDGRLIREAHSYLCSPKNAGNFHSFILDDKEEDMKKNIENAEIDCHSCLKLMERWKRKN